VFNPQQIGGHEAGSLLIAGSERMTHCDPSLIAPNRRAWLLRRPRQPARADCPFVCGPDGHYVGHQGPGRRVTPFP